MIQLTQRATEKILEIRSTENLGDQGLRLKVIGGGCSGFQYDLHFEDTVADTDEVLSFNNIDLYVDMISFQYLDETTIDYIDELYGSGFKFLNPKAKATCGCGSSFNV
jgi:iron-sulfur cluster insertion protein